MKKIKYNSPVILTFTLLSFAVLLLSFVTGGVSNNFFSVSNYGFLNPMTYIGIFTHILGHANWTHFLGNFSIILLIGPVLEEKYGSKNMILIILFTAFVTGTLSILLFPSTTSLGASGIVFSFIILISFVNVEEKTIPLTFILIFIIYIGQEIVNGIFNDDNVGQFSHIIGGLSAVFLANLLYKKSQIKKI